MLILSYALTTPDDGVNLVKLRKQGKGGGQVFVYNLAFVQKVGLTGSKTQVTAIINNDNDGDVGDDDDDGDDDYGVDASQPIIWLRFEIAQKAS